MELLQHAEEFHWSSIFFFFFTQGHQGSVLINGASQDSGWFCSDCKPQLQERGHTMAKASIKNLLAHIVQTSQVAKNNHCYKTLGDTTEFVHLNSPTLSAESLLV